MADADLRDLERRAALGDVDAGAQLLRAQIQSGELTAVDVRRMAYRQDAAALALERAAGVSQDRLTEFAGQVATRRAALSEGEREALDAAFYAAFVRATGGRRREGELEPLADLRALLERGAGTGAFEDRELGPDNFGATVKAWLRRDAHRSDADMAEALGICIEAGPAFVTNRGYFGNGGLSAVWFVFEWFAESTDTGRVPYVQGLLEAMCAAAEPRSPFWQEFLQAFLDMFLQPLGRAGGPLSEAQGWVARFALNLALDPPDLATGRAAWRSTPYIDDVVVAGRALIGLSDDGLLDLASKNVGVFKAAGVSFETAEGILKGALSDVRRRKTLGALIRRSPWLRDQIFSLPQLVFSLVRRRERKLLAVLLAVDLERMRAVRDEGGNDLLLVACAMKGRTEKFVALLLQRGFDPTIRNDRGEGAVELAARVGNEKLLALLSA